ncbi:protein phosphatase type 1 complex subunit Hex2/Reg1 [Neurospora crassa OR74A]|uniref:Protein phosphatase type 1 complex subunit Hex2/Reg1 n=1 Tax=Neurospora crassa (strain ATCC 24698 / 74-OR23-1A / CBS 708.71 / DSM 1257 / FGSC 987) TaxID=367110 RepID=V5IQL7_NEUCR|nr:protein phosphatase type 1 complex subunit Hex2/Reg1 [Neurospora crassa OR74A]ESA44010.1 protein phosphatase type 1 complex subunit Hex2/Reg1 [Neurospora crassa OR74A]|eukprot:XP_011393269.1 protein phosphatase type 1 complex subunit Hex2/Reg1 [Neurospora crassa OR74A]
MAVVITSDDDTFFGSPLRRSQSQPKFNTKRSGFHTSASTSRLSDIYHHSSKAFDHSAPSSAPSSPRGIHLESSELSDSSTPVTNPSLTSDSDDEDVLEAAISRRGFGGRLSRYEEDVGYFNHVEHSGPPPSPRTDQSYTSSPSGNDTSTPTSRPESPELVYDRAEDDIAIKIQPSRHVDYLSHNWREEDIWSSWKHIVARRGDYANSARLENASWRTWMKSKNNLGTVSPETLNWLKDCDVTWLYGPLQTGPSIHSNTSSNDSTRMSKTNSFAKKPILKKRSMSELMLQRSLSASSLVKQAAAAVQAQQKGCLKKTSRRPGLDRANTDFVTFPFSSRGLSNDNSLFATAVSSGLVSPSGERKHIHFNEQVAQCIAVEIKGDDDEDDVEPEINYNSDSDDDAIMMKRTKGKKLRPILKRSKSHSHSGGESRTIAMLPSTTLKYREDTPEPAESAMKHSTGVFRGTVLSPSSSQETLRPAKKSGRFFVDSDDEDDEDDEPTSNWSSAKSTEGSIGGLRRSTSSASLLKEPAGMRRTESGMFMPYEQGEDSNSEGLLGRVIDTVNTARDIVHVIWNVGWKR